MRQPANLDGFVISVVDSVVELFINPIPVGIVDVFVQSHCPGSGSDDVLTTLRVRQFSNLQQPADLDGFVISIVDSVVELFIEHQYEDDRRERGPYCKIVPKFQSTHSLKGNAQISAD